MSIKFVFNSIKNDFEYELLNALEYQKWYNPDLYDFEILLMDIYGNFNLDNYRDNLSNTELFGGGYKLVPIGDLSFVRRFTRDVLDRELKSPITIPSSLYYYLNRKVLITETGINSAGRYYELLDEIRGDNDKVFVKNISQYKKYSGIVDINEPLPKEIENNMGNNYLFSEYISNIVSEFRIFVYKGEIVGCYNYLGNPFYYPNKYFIEEIVDNYKDCCPAYSLDIAVTSDGTNKLLEIHPLVSCGLYGLREYDKLPQMMARAYRWILK